MTIKGSAKCSGATKERVPTTVCFEATTHHLLPWQQEGGVATHRVHPVTLETPQLPQTTTLWVILCLVIM